jgi:hypothetical protein
MIPIGILSSVTSSTSLLLDEYPNAAAAYSLRKLRAGYTGAAIQVRRLSDGSILDIGFVNNVLDTTTLLTFVGASSGNVNIWYDQSGNGNNAQATFNTFAGNLIVSSGVLQMQNSKPSINFVDGTSLQLTTQISSAVNTSVFLIGKANSMTTGGAFLGHTSPGGSGPAMGQYLGNYLIQALGSGTSLDVHLTAANSADTNFNVINLYFTGTQVPNIYRNNTNIPITSSSTFAASSNNFWNIGSYSSAYKTFGFYSEVIIYKTDQLANRTGIVNNINTFYTLF